MKFVWYTVLRDVKDETPVLSGKKVDGHEIFEYGTPMKRMITEDNVAFQVDASEDVPPKGTRLKITIETI